MLTVTLLVNLSLFLFNCTAVQELLPVRSSAKSDGAAFSEVKCPSDY